MRVRRPPHKRRTERFFLRFYLASGTIRGKGVALGDGAIHLSIQDLQPAVTPAKPFVDRQVLPRGPAGR